jgi:hypothetical protein
MLAYVTYIFFVCPAPVVMLTAIFAYGKLPVSYSG